MGKSSKPLKEKLEIRPEHAEGTTLVTFSGYSSGLLLFLVFSLVVVVGLFVIRDLRRAGAAVQQMYAGSVLGLDRIGDLRYAAQETRRCTFYALTTTDSNLQIKYAKESREADHLVTAGIAEYLNEAKTPVEVEVGRRLRHDWSTYLDVRDQVLASILEGSNKEAVDVDLKVGTQLFDHVRQDLEQIDRIYDDQASQRLASVAASSRRTSIRVVAVLGITLVFAVISVWAIQRSRVQSALQLARLQMEFVASVSHELRTPLAVISSAADNIADGLVGGWEEQQKYGRAIQNQSRQITDLVNQILLFAAVKEQKSRYLKRVLQISEVIDSALEGTSELLRSSGFTLDMQIQPGLPPIRGDLSALTQCIQNLIGNAVKYSGGNKWISVMAYLADSDLLYSKEVRVAVQDHGIGIERSELPRIFEPFYRCPAVVAKQIHGTGLGLSLSNSIAEDMGGKLTVTSKVGVGSVFTLHLPAVEDKI